MRRPSGWMIPGAVLSFTIASPPLAGGERDIPLRAEVLFASQKGACLRDSHQHVRCWGDGQYLQVDYGAGPQMIGTGPKSSRPVEVPSLMRAQQIVFGAEHACALQPQGKVSCWGNGEHGQLGDGKIRVAPPVYGGGVGPDKKVARGATARSPVCSGVHETCAPALVPSLADVREIAAGTSHTCARLGDGTVRCWGSNDRRQLGAARGGDQATPVAVPRITDAQAIAAAGDQTCAVTGRSKQQRLMCWGVDRNGPQQIVTAPIASISLTPSAGGCARETGGEVLCWGADVMKILGVKSSRGSAPVRVAALKGATQIGLAERHGCALFADGHVACFGHNESGRTGIGSNEGWIGVTALSLEHVTQIAVGSHRSYALSRDGEVRAWGANWGALGIGTVTPEQLTPAVLSIR